MRRVPLATKIAILALVFSIAALADLKGKLTLTANSALNLDTGATVASGGDILWSGSSMKPQSNATAVNIGALGALQLFLWTVAGRVHSHIGWNVRVPRRWWNERWQLRYIDCLPHAVVDLD